MAPLDLLLYMCAAALIKSMFQPSIRGIPGYNGDEVSGLNQNHKGEVLGRVA